MHARTRVFIRHECVFSFGTTRFVADTGDEKRRLRAAAGGGQAGPEGHLRGAAVLQGVRGGREGHGGVQGVRGAGGEGEMADQAQEHSERQVRWLDGTRGCTEDGWMDGGCLDGWTYGIGV